MQDVGVESRQIKLDLEEMLRENMDWLYLV